MGPIILARNLGAVPARPPKLDLHLAIQTESHQDAPRCGPEIRLWGSFLRGKHGVPEGPIQGGGVCAQVAYVEVSGAKGACESLLE